jgi:hypothetical protein
MKIIAILPGNRAIVDTTDLYRVVTMPMETTIGELLDADEAEAMARGFNNCMADDDVLDDFVEARRAKSLVEMFNGMFSTERTVAIPYSAIEKGGVA